jgi:transmembrane sensor
MLKLVPRDDSSHGGSADGGSADDAALAWVVRLTSGASTPEDHAEFRHWRDQSPAHAQALDRARTLWSHLGTALPEIERKHRNRVSRWRGVGQSLAIAASLMLAVGMGHQYWYNWRFDQVTATGEHRTIAMTDGTRATLGADTAINERFDGHERRVVLARGQAFFRVQPDAARPFIVETASGEIRDIGTAFNVAVTGRGTRVVVSEGVVEASDGRRRVRMIANQGIDIAPSGLGRVSAADSDQETAWIRRRLIIADKPLGEILASIAPYYSKRIVLLNRTAAARQMSAVIDLSEGGVDRWIHALGKTGAVRAIPLPGVLILR